MGRLRPSSAPRWGHCSGSVLATESIPSFDSPASIEGSAGHELGAACVLARLGRSGDAVDPFDYVGAVASNGFVWDAKAAEGATAYVNDFMTVYDREIAQGHTVTFWVEAPLTMHAIHPENDGTTDAALWVHETGRLYVWDYKHGYRNVEAENNLQLIDYLAGLVEALKIDGLQGQHIHCELRVVQPFCYSADESVKVFRERLSYFRGHFNQLRSKAYDAFNNPSFTTGPHCRDCPILWTCSAARGYVSNIINMIEVSPDVDRMDPRSLAIERDILRDGLAVGSARRDAIEDHLMHLIQKGDTETGYTIEVGKGRGREWSIPPGQVIAMGAMLGIETDSKKPKTPTQVLDSLPADKRDKLGPIILAKSSPKTGKKKLLPIDKTIGARAFRKTKDI